MTLSKRLAAIAGTLAMVALVVSPVVADAAVEQSNNNTGNNSNNTNRIRVRHNQTITKTNRARVNNSLVVEATTGGNESNANTRGGEIKTGDVDADIEITNKVNENSDCDNCLSNHDSDIDVDQENKNTGNRSTNRNVVRINNGGSVEITNRANINNSITLSGNTGDNESNRNTRGGKIDTGDISFEISIKNTAN